MATKTILQRNCLTMQLNVVDVVPFVIFKIHVFRMHTGFIVLQVAHLSRFIQLINWALSQMSIASSSP